MQMASQAKTNTTGDFQNLVSLCIVYSLRMNIRCCEIISSQSCMTISLYTYTEMYYKESYFISCLFFCIETVSSEVFFR